MYYEHPENKHKYKLTCRPPLYEIQMVNENYTPSQTMRLTSSQYSSMLNKLESTGWRKTDGSSDVRFSNSKEKQYQRY